MKLSISTPQNEGFYQASKWLKVQVLVDEKELEELFLELSPFSIFPLSGFRDGSSIKQSFFLKEYGGWIEKLKNGKIPEDSELKTVLPSAFIKDEKSLWLQEIPGKGFLTKVREPILQVQAHFFTYSSLDRVFRPMSLGQNSIFWGLQFSYPQIYQDPKTGQIQAVKEMELFKTVRKWVREKTRATPFFVDGQKSNSSMRLGKNCFSWIPMHGQLKQQNILVL